MVSVLANCWSFLFAVFENLKPKPLSLCILYLSGFD